MNPPVPPYATPLLIFHLLVAVTLLGAVTHQALAVWWPAAEGPSVEQSFRSVRVAIYTNFIVILYVTMVVIGATLYPIFRNHVSPELVRLHYTAWQGVFDLKEHIVSIGLGTLAVYWYYWKKVPVVEHHRARAALTAIIAFCVWYAFLAGHLLNNIKGFGA